MATRPPLSTAKHENILSKPTDVSKDAEGRLKKALANLAEERRKRAEVEGVVDLLKRGKDEARASVACMMNELGLAQAEIKAQKATIMRLTAASATQASQTTPKDQIPAGIEAKLQELMVKHDQAKVKYQAEVTDLRTSNTTLQTLISTLQASLATEKQTISDLRGNCAILKKELETLKSRPSAALIAGRDEKAEEWSRFKEERLAWRKEKMGLEAELKVAQKAVSEGERNRVKVDELEGKVERLEEALEGSARACALLKFRSVGRDEHEQIKEAFVLERSANVDLRRALQLSRRECRKMEEDNRDLRDHIDILQEQCESLSQDLEEVMQQRQVDRLEQQVSSSTSNSLAGHTASTPDIDVTTSTDLLEILDLVLSHIALSDCHTTSLTSLHLSTLSSLRVELESTSCHLHTSRDTLCTLEATHTSTKAELDAMLLAHADCGEQILHWRGESSRSGATTARLRSQLQETSTKLEELEERAKGEREMLRRANEGSARWGAAKVALEDEIRALRLALMDARGLEQRYNLLEDEAEILRSREVMAVEEADRLGAQNAELIGHSNGVQKISYVEGLRREMALVKHELATARHHLNLSTSQITDLQAELESYKSISPSLLSASTGTGRVRVARRQPEPDGGEVIGASLARRSVFGSVRH